MNTRQKGHIGHVYTEQYLHSLGWSTEAWPHATVQWNGGSGGWYDMYCVRDEETGRGSYGGFDVMAHRPIIATDMRTNEPRKIAEGTFWQVKKTRRNPITPALRRETIESADQNNLPLSACYIIWWPDRHGPKGKPPVIWRCDDADQQTISMAIQ